MNERLRLNTSISNERAASGQRLGDSFNFFGGSQLAHMAGFHRTGSFLRAAGNFNIGSMLG